MDVKNVINPSLFEGEDSDLILDKIPPPQLHVMMGGANKIWDVLSSLWGEEAEVWARTKGITKHGYNGGGLDGVNSSLLLHRADELASVCPFKLIPMVVALQKLHRLVNGCFSHDLAEDIDIRFSDFTVALKSLEDYAETAGIIYLTSLK